MRDPRSGAFGLVDYPLFEPGVAPFQNVGGQLRVSAVGVGPQRLEQCFNPQGGLLTKRVGQLVGLLAADLIVYALTKKGRVEASNYRTVKVPSNGT